MAKADVLQLVQELSLNQADTLMAEKYYYEVINGLDDNRDVLTSVEIIQSVTDTAVYALPERAVRLLGAFYDDQFLNRATVQEIESYAGTDWQAIKGQPLVTVVERENEKQFRLFPKPVAPSGDFSFAFGSPLGHDYPVDSIAVAVTQVQDDLPAWLELPVVFEILAKEFARESNHYDRAFSETCKGVAALLFAMVL